MNADEHSNLITVFLILLCILAFFDLWRQYAIKDESFWFDQYSKAVRAGVDNWNFGYRLEDLEIKLDEQHNRWKKLEFAIDRQNEAFFMEKQVIRKPHHIDLSSNRQHLNAISAYSRNLSSIYEIKCEKDGPNLRVGVNDFRTNDKDACQVFTGSITDVMGPNTMFEKILLDSGSFALRSLANGNFVKTVPPPQDNIYAPWKLVVGGPDIGAAERFRLTEEGYLYSPLLGGFFQCTTNEMVKGYTGIYGGFDSFILVHIDEHVAVRAQNLVELSHQIQAIQGQYSDMHVSSENIQKQAVEQVLGSDNPNHVRICIAVPMTSKGTDMKSVKDSPFWTNLFDSFMRSIDWRSNRYIFKFYLGFDKADSFYDTGDAWTEFRDEFQSRAGFRMSELQMEQPEIEAVLKTKLSLKLNHYDHLVGAPTQIVSQLVLSAYVDNFDYFYQVNDDTIIVTPNWVPKLITALASNPFIPNFGVTGPVDTNNEKIFTHSFTHRTHVEIFGHLFPPSFKNWWSDDWISTVYGSEHTFSCADVQINHNVGAQKLHGANRYEIDEGAKLRLFDELLVGHVQIDEWLKRNSLPRLPLPVVCGYIPLTRFLFKTLIEKKDHGKTNTKI